MAWTETKRGNRNLVSRLDSLETTPSSIISISVRWEFAFTRFVLF